MKIAEATNCKSKCLSNCFGLNSARDFVYFSNSGSLSARLSGWMKSKNWYRWGPEPLGGVGGLKATLFLHDWLAESQLSSLNPESNVDKLISNEIQ